MRPLRGMAHYQPAAKIIKELLGVKKVFGLTSKKRVSEVRRQYESKFSEALTELEDKYFQLKHKQENDFFKLCGDIQAGCRHIEEMRKDFDDWRTKLQIRLDEMQKAEKACEIRLDIMDNDNARKDIGYSEPCHKCCYTCVKAKLVAQERGFSGLMCSLAHGRVSPLGCCDSYSEREWKAGKDA